MKALSVLVWALLAACVLCEGDAETVSVEVGADGEVKAQQQQQRPQFAKKKEQKPKTVLPTTHPAAIGVKIRNPRSHWVDYYWWSGSKSVYQGRIEPRGVTATNSYVGHVFYFTPQGKPDEEFERINVVHGKNLYILPPENEDDPYYQELLAEQRFMTEYQERTGRPWLAHYPRDPPILHMWPADEVGQVHKVKTEQSFWNCVVEDTDSEEFRACRSDDLLELELEVLSKEPKVFRINNMLSEAEVDLILSLAKPKIKRSLAGNHGGLVSDTRTSSTAWLDRKEHYVLDTLFRRAADVLNVSEALLVPTRNVEQLQIVNYQVGQEYTSHHDFGADGRPQQRMITLLLYLNDQAHEEAGGETAFPKAKGGEIRVHPGKGNAVLFYSLLEDGNADDLSLHAALPVKEGEKWISNFWVWDPHR